jgi:hypothetical protein
MDEGGGHDRLAFLGRRLPAAFEPRVVVLAPGHRRAHVHAECRDALVAVSRRRPDGRR